MKLYNVTRLDVFQNESLILRYKPTIPPRQLAAVHCCTRQEILTRWSEIADFEPIFAYSASAVTPSEKKSINTNRKSTTRFPMSLR